MGVKPTSGTLCAFSNTVGVHQNVDSVQCNIGIMNHVLFAVKVLANFQSFWLRRILAKLRTGKRRNYCSISRRVKKFSSPKTSRQAVGPTQPPVQYQ